VTHPDPLTTLSTWVTIAQMWRQYRTGNPIPGKVPGGGKHPPNKRKIVVAEGKVEGLRGGHLGDGILPEGPKKKSIE